MFASSIPSASGTGQVTNLASGASSQAVSSSDEDKALVELFHILWELSVGVVDFPASSGAKEGAMGPMRAEVENLKELLRRIMSWNGAGQDSGNGKPDRVSLTQLYESMPPEIRNLLLRAFPKLRDMLREDAASADSSGKTPSFDATLSSLLASGPFS
jgi:hypothetical protein